MNLLLLIIVFLVDPGRDKIQNVSILGRPIFGVDILGRTSFGVEILGRPSFGVDILGRPFFGVDRSELSQPVDFQVTGRLRTLVNNQSLENIVAEFFAIFSFTSNYDIIKFESILKK